MEDTTPETLHISGYGKKLKKHHNMLVVEWKKEEEDMSLSFTPSRLSHVILSGEHMVSTGGIRLLLDNDVAFSYLDSFGNPIGYLFPHHKSRHIELWEKQINMDPIHSMEIASSICVAVAKNKISLLQSMQRSRGVELGGFVADIKSIMENMYDLKENSVLMGYEGMVSNIYFSALKMLIPEEFGFNSRIKHPSPDPVNVMLSYGYGILYSKVRLALMKMNLNPFCGVLHVSYKSQEALVYDLIEEFRQPVVDKTILTLIGRRQVSPDDFTVSADQCEIKESFKKNFAGSILSRIESETKYDDGNKEIGEIINLQAKKLRDAIENKTAYEAFVFRTR